MRVIRAPDIRKWSEHLFPFASLLDIEWPNRLDWKSKKTDVGTIRPEFVRSVFACFTERR